VNPRDAVELLSAMITPAVLISASGTLILSTSLRLGRVMDRVRELARTAEDLFTASGARFAELRRRGVEQQLGLYMRRGRLLQGALTGFYVALGVFVATTIAIALVSYAAAVAWVPAALGIGGMLILFYGCLMLLGETRLALLAIDTELTFVHELTDLHRREASAPGKPPEG
jgi:hypothetical protein